MVEETGTPKGPVEQISRVFDNNLGIVFVISP